ncbi:hypothetical protein SLEP1_g29219 [Rubroshorea leprosula]|uniref:Uncharacterized protein n=1 Tax=Rubroshorea leprosula TaxID=152421 RepID=A0AAV5K2B5_9ROSI|nr:hypothetical protein SLEP1_g29219 [Rubroshorea leprosula]
MGGGEQSEMAQRQPGFLVHEDASNSLLQNSRCCFCFPRFGSSHRSSTDVPFWERIRVSQIESGNNLWARGIRAFKKIREWSEIVAGPRWKTFIRRFNRNRSGGGSGSNRNGKFQYDPLSYALNFDEGPGQIGNFDEDEEHGGFHAFSTRYAAVPGSATVKASASPTSSSLDIRKDVSVFG